MRTTSATIWVQITIALAGSCSLPSAFSNESSQGTAPPLWSAPAQAARKANPVSSNESSIARGKEFYVKECLACHGASGKGDGPKAGELKVHPGDLSNTRMRQQSDGALFWKITEGKTPMPSFR